MITSKCPIAGVDTVAGQRTLGKLETINVRFDFYGNRMARQLKWIAEQSKQADLAKVGVKIIFEGDNPPDSDRTSGNVSITEVPLLEALSYLLSANGCAFRIDGDTVVVFRANTPIGVYMPRVYNEKPFDSRNQSVIGKLASIQIRHVAFDNDDLRTVAGKLTKESLAQDPLHTGVLFQCTSSNSLSRENTNLQQHRVNSDYTDLLLVDLLSDISFRNEIDFEIKKGVVILFPRSH